MKKNISNTLIDEIVLVIERGTLNRLIPFHKKIKISWIENRPTYQDLFNVAKETLGDEKGLMLISNSEQLISQSATQFCYTLYKNPVLYEIG